MENILISPGKFRLDGGAMFGIIPKPLWNKVHPADDYNRIDLDLRLWIIKDQDRIIITDTGIGDYHGEKFDQQFDVRQEHSPLVKALADKGIDCADVTDLVISHLHFDHVGGMVYKDENGEFAPVFPNATIHLHKDHWEYALNPTVRDGGSFHTQYFKETIEKFDKAGRVHWLTGKEGEILKLSDDSLRFKCSYGHTPHLIHPYTNEYIYLADLIPTSNHVHVPWVMGYDIAPGQTTMDKIEFLKMIVEKDLRVIFEHDPKYASAKITQNERGKYIPVELE
ncbi:MBL fold metallo-hydrolase [Halobacteriovorax sp. RZ-1]|uniref:MBL fold metallo-hydrolase n=1 Tax=unclassified Halobacteriovorax TaxID=2639665 RepID=UPI0037132715